MDTRKFSGNKVIVFLALVAVVFAVGYFYKNNAITGINTENEDKKEAVQAAITTENIKEENFSGTVARISGSGIIVTEAQKYIENTLSEFKTQANTDVPAMRAQFGADSPSANYTIDINAARVQSDKTESIAINIYSYTGGAHGNSSFKVITASKETGKILSLSDIVEEDKKAAFTEFVKKELMSWGPNGSTAPVVFPEEVANLKFESFQNWSLDEKNLTLYFSQYEIGPGVLGPVAFPLPLTKIKDFLK